MDPKLKAKGDIKLHLDNVREVVHLRAVSGMAYPRAQESFSAIEKLIETLTAPIDALIEASSLGTPEATEARQCVDPAIVEGVLRRADEIREDQALVRGFAIAVAQMVRHQSNPRDLLRMVCASEEVLLRAGVEEFDLEVLRPVLAQLEEN